MDDTVGQEEIRNRILYYFIRAVIMETTCPQSSSLRTRGVGSFRRSGQVSGELMAQRTKLLPPEI